MVRDHPASDAVEPGPHGRASLEVPQLPVHDDEDILDDVVHRALFGAEATSQPPDEVEVLLIDRLEGRALLDGHRRMGSGVGGSGQHIP